MAGLCSDCGFAMTTLGKNKDIGCFIKQFPVCAIITSHLERRQKNCLHSIDLSLIKHNTLLIFYQSVLCKLKNLSITLLS